MGINLTLIGQIGTFLVFWWFVHKFVWPVFSKIAAERQRKISDGLSMADGARHALTQAEQESQEIIAKAKAQANTILAQANQQATHIVESAREEAKKAGDVEKAQAQAQIEQSQRQVRDALKSQLSALVIDGVQKVIEREVNPKDHERLLQELSEKL